MQNNFKSVLSVGLFLISLGTTYVCSELFFYLLLNYRKQTIDAQWLNLEEGSFLSCILLDSEVIYRPLKNQTKSTCTHTDSWGFRPSGYAVPKEGTQILMMGDSFTWGHGVEDRESYPAYTQKIFNEADISVEILNAGVPGYGTDQHLVYLEQLLEEGIRPEVLVWNINENDNWDNDWACLHRVQDQELRRYPGWLNTMYLLGMTKQWFAYVDYEPNSYQYFVQTLPNRWTFGCSIDGYDWKLDPYRENKNSLLVDHMQKLGKQYNFTLVTTYIQGPFAYGDPEKPDSYDRFTQSRIATLVNSKLEPLVISDHILQTLSVDTLASGTKLPPNILGVSKTYPAADLFLEDSEFDAGAKHMNAKGNYLFAQVVFERLKPLLSK